VRNELVMARPLRIIIRKTRVTGGRPVTSVAELSWLATYRANRCDSSRDSSPPFRRDVDRYCRLISHDWCKLQRRGALIRIAHVTDGFSRESELNPLLNNVKRPSAAKLARSIRSTSERERVESRSRMMYNERMTQPWRDRASWRARNSSIPQFRVFCPGAHPRPHLRLPARARARATRPGSAH